MGANNKMLLSKPVEPISTIESTYPKSTTAPSVLGVSRLAPKRRIAIEPKIADTNQAAR